MTPRPWEVLASEPVAQHPPWLAVRRDRVRLPTGAVLPDYYVLSYPDWVNVVAATDSGALVMVRQWRHAFGGLSLELPGGAADAADASPEAAARRELLEETGHGGGAWRHLLTCSPNPATHTNRAHTFVAEGVAPLAAPHADAGEDIEVCLIPPAELPGRIAAGEVPQAMHVAAILLYLRSLEDR